MLYLTLLGFSAAMELLPEAGEWGSQYLKDQRKLHTTALPTSLDTFGKFQIDVTRLNQTIWGIGFEIQSDSIGSGNHGLPESNSSVPWELTPSERTRLAKEMLLGFRFCRLALGLYFRGTTPDEKNIVERWPGQAQALATMAAESQIEGFDVEYWSPPPGWKTSKSYIGGTLTGFDATTLDAFSDAVVNDLVYLEAQGIHPVQWGLQNEPPYTTPYSCCVYNPQQYYSAFSACAPKIKHAFPNITIHVCSNTGQTASGALVAGDAKVSALVDGWTWHCVGCPSTSQLGGNIDKFLNGSQGKRVWNNEFEYLDNKVNDNRTLNTAQSVMNWLVFGDSPTWYWLHALKPTVNVEAPGYGLGYWRPLNDTNFTRFPDLPPGNWQYNDDNANAVLGFAKYMPWDAVRVHTEEDVLRPNARVLAYLYNPSAALWLHPHDRVHHARVFDPPGPQRDASAREAATHLAFVLTNSDCCANFTTSVILTGLQQSEQPTFSGHAYSPTIKDGELGVVTPVLNSFGHLQVNITVPPLTIQFWVQQ